MSDERTPWPKHRVDDLCLAIVDCVNRTAPVVDGPTPFRMIRTTNVRNGVIDLSETRFVDEGTFKTWTRRQVPLPGDVVLTREAPLGEVGMIRPGAHVFLGQRLVSYRTNPDLLDNRYLLYYLQSPAGKAQVQSFGMGSTVAHMRVPDAKNLLIPTPPIDTQRRIAAILGAYDDLIEVNRRRVAVLEEMARGLFEEWFVRFRFPGHESVPLVDTPDGPLPQGWAFTNLYDVAEVAFGFAFKSKAFTTTPKGSRVVRIRDVPDGITSTWTLEPYDPRYAVVDGDILIGMDGIFHMNFWVGGDAALNQRVTRLRPTAGRSCGWLFRSVYPKIKYFEATISGTTVAHLGAKHLKTIVFPLADPEIQQRADAFFDPIDQAVVDLRITNQRLAASRDLLLPRLISGQLSVAAAERELELAA